MPRFVALLRGVNMAGHKKLAMAELRALAESLGFAKAQTLLQSGNLVFSASGKPAALEAKLERELAKKLKLETTVMVRTAAEWQAVAAANPYREEAVRDPSHLALMVLKDKPAPKAVAALKGAAQGPEVFTVRGRAIYAFFPEGFARAKFTTALIDRRLQTVATGRNWNTVTKLAKLLEA